MRDARTLITLVWLPVIRITLDNVSATLTDAANHQQRQKQRPEGYLIRDRDLD